MKLNACLLAGSLLLAVSASSAAGAQSLPGFLNSLGAQAQPASTPPGARPMSGATPSRKKTSTQPRVKATFPPPARRKHPVNISQDNG